MKKSLLLNISIVLGMAMLLLIGCKKSNHDTLVALGDEHYMRSIDDIYPERYRNEWPTITPSVNTSVYEGIFPPDLNGEYVIKGDLVGGNEVLHQANGVDLPGSEIYPYYKNQYTYFKISEQKNGLAKVYLRMYFNNNPDVYESPVTDTAFIFGNGRTGEFTMVFNATSEMGVGEQYYGFLISGKRCEKIVGNDTIQGIENIRRWHVVKGKTDNLPYYYYVDGQRLYKDINDFTEKVDYGWGPEDGK